MLSITDEQVAKAQGEGMAIGLSPRQLAHIGRGIAEALTVEQLKAMGEGIQFNAEEIIGYEAGRAIGAALVNVLKETA